MEQGAERGELSPRERAGLALDWARKHILNPCGETPAEKAFMRRLHQGVIKKVFEDPGVRDALTPEEQDETQELLER